MADLAVNLFGLDFPNPVWTAAGPTVRNGEMVARQVAGGAGGAVCKTISSTAARPPAFHMLNLSRGRKEGLLNTELWSELPPGDWLEREYAVALRAGVPVIASVGYTADEVVRLGAAAERAGVHALEVTVHYAKEEPWQVMKALRAAVSIPLIAKLSPHDPAGLVETARRLEPYVDAVAAVNSLGPALRIDIETGRRLLGSELGTGWLSGPPIKPLALAIVFDLARTLRVPVIGVGGVRTGADVVEFLMAGASAVQVCTANILEGPQVFGRITKELDTWLDEHAHATARELTGLYARRLGAGPAAPVAGQADEGAAAEDGAAAASATTRVRYEAPPPRLVPHTCNLCGTCARLCPYDALTMEKKGVRIDAARCHGCGLCVSVCPTGALEMDVDTELGPAGRARPW